MPAFAPEQLLPVLTSCLSAPRCWIAYSGGMDSEVLLHAVASLRDCLPCEVHAVHVDHGLHALSYRWAEHCRAHCDRLAVPLRVLRVDAAAARGESPEAAARGARYRALAGLLGSGDLLLTAHHRDDQAETLLLALMRGSGLRGLAAMPQIASLGAGHLLRPLLTHGRADLRDYAERAGLHWIEDPSNLEQAFDRNFLRHRVFPLLAERWPACSITIARSSDHCAEAGQLLEEFAEKELEGLAGTRPGTLSVSGLKTRNMALGKLLLRRWVAALGLPPPDLPHSTRILTEILNARPDARPLVSWTGCEVRRFRDDLFAMIPLPPSPPPGLVRWRNATIELPPGLGRLTLFGESGQQLDPELHFQGGLLLGFGLEGLDCRPAAGARRRPLKKLFQEAGIPPWLRSFVPLVFCGTVLFAVGDRWMCRDRHPLGEFQIRWDGGIRTHAGFPALRR